MNKTMLKSVCPSCGQANPFIGRCIICGKNVCTNCGGDEKTKVKKEHVIGEIVFHWGECLRSYSQGLIWTRDKKK